MINIETLLWDLWTRDLDSGQFFSSETDISADDPLPLPALIYSMQLDGQTQNGPHLWTGLLTVDILGEPIPAWDLASNVYDIIHAWPTGPVVDGVGHVQTVTDISAFSRTSTTQIVGKGVVQYAGSFALASRN